MNKRISPSKWIKKFLEANVEKHKKILRICPYCGEPADKRITRDGPGCGEFYFVYLHDTWECKDDC